MKLPKFKQLLFILKFVYRSNRWLVITRELALLVQVTLQVWSITLAGKFIDATANYISNYTSFNFIQYFTSDSFYYLALTTGFAILIISLDKYREAALGGLNNQVLFDFQTEFFKKISSSNLEEVESKEFRNLLTLTDTYSFGSMWDIYQTFTDLVKNVVTGISSLILLINLANWYALLIVIISLPQPLVGYYYRRKRHHFEEKEVEKTKWNRYVENLMTRIQYFMEMKVDNTFRNIKKEYSEKSEYLKKNRTHIHYHFIIDTTLFAVIGKVLTVIYVIYGFAISIVKRVTIGNIKVMYDYANSVYDSFSNIFEMIFQISNWIGYASNFQKFLEYEGFGDQADGQEVVSVKTPSLRFMELDFKYPNEDTNTLENLNATFQPGEKVMIIGDDGSGKSTLVKLLCGLYKIESGDYEIDSKSIRILQRGQLKSKIAAVFQDFVNYNMSLKKNIILSSDISTFKPELFEKSLKISGVDKLMKKYDISENQILGKYVAGGREISPGFWQRIAIARMIYRDKGISILDEPFTYIDNQEEERILKEFLTFAGKEKTVIYITRDNHHTKLFDTIYHLKDGKLIKK